jgi:hypothetical protein
MKTLRRSFAHVFSLVAFTLPITVSILGNECASAETLSGAVEQKAEYDTVKASPTITLQGGVKDAADLKHSVELTPGDNPRLQSGAKQNKFPLSVRKEAPASKPSQDYTSQTPSLGTPARTEHVMPPISTYQLRPSLGVTHSPGYAIKSVQNGKGISAYVPGFEVEHVSTNNHVVSSSKSYSTPVRTTYSGNRSVRNTWALEMPLVRGSDHGASNSPTNKLIIGRGVVSYDEEHNVSAALNSERKTSRVTQTSVTTRSGVASYEPGYEVTLVAAPKTNSLWIPGHDSLIASASMSKQTLGGIWYSPEPVATVVEPNPGVDNIHPEYVYAQPVVADRGNGLTATARLLPGAESAMGSEWDDWFDSIGRSIYSRWQRADVGPGTVRIRVNVDRFRNLNCEVVNFRPATFVARDTVAETAFRITALRAVRDLSTYEIPELPTFSAQKHSINFDMDMSRSVDGSEGFHIAKPIR